ncbi:hypothetical protein [Halorussus caseinilyticus]|uniref:Methyltransferase domain-containing protein n=1 Tax=Halorussus caseinilyticus TaxID=3034025 RepID=A0ABD5WUI6_9EURY
MSSDRYAIDDVAFIGRTVEEYEHMFDLDLSAWEGQSVLDCPGGACAFVAEANTRDIDAVGVDILYDVPPDELHEKCESDVDTAIAGFEGVEDQFIWEFYDDVADVRAHWTAAYQEFIADYADRFDTDRYVDAQLPDLPFEDDSFSLVLSANLMFLYMEKFDYEFHEQSLLELARVASDEVRVYPSNASTASATRDWTNSARCWPTRGTRRNFGRSRSGSSTGPRNSSESRSESHRPTLSARGR